MRYTRNKPSVNGPGSAVELHCISSRKILWGVTTLTNAVSGQSQNCSANLEISPGIGTLGNFSGKHAIILGHCRKKSGHGDPNFRGDLS